MKLANVILEDYIAQSKSYVIRHIAQMIRLGHKDIFVRFEVTTSKKQAAKWRQQKYLEEVE